MVLKKAYGLADDAGVDLVAQIGDGGEAAMLNLHRANVFGDGFAKKENDERNGENRPDVMDARGKIIIEIDDPATPGNRAERQARTGGPRIENEVHGQPDHERHAPFGEGHKGYQDHADSEPERVRPHISQQTLQLW